MTDVLDARDAYLAARHQVAETRIALGHAIADARAHGVDQVKIAKTLDLTREQIRRYEAEYRKSLAASA